MSDPTPADPARAPLHLGQTSALPASPDEAVLDYVPNPRPGALYLVRFAAPEWCSRWGRAQDGTALTANRDRLVLPGEGRLSRCRAGGENR